MMWLENFFNEFLDSKNRKLESGFQKSKIEIQKLVSKKFFDTIFEIYTKKRSSDQNFRF